MSARTPHSGRMRVAAAGLLAIAMCLTGAPAGVVPAGAAGCVTITGGAFNAPGADSFMPGLNGEWVSIRNGCSWAVGLTGYRVRDRGAAHVYRFPLGFRLHARGTVRLHSGTGTNTSSDLYWGRRQGEVWNNRPPEWAYLVNRSGTVVSRWSWPLAPVVSHGSRMKRRLALTIDDGYNPTACRQLLAILRREGVTATWLPYAKAMGADPALWRTISAGYPIANHTFSHPFLTRLSIGAQYDELVRARARVRQITGRRIAPILRPPYGSYNADTRRAATAAGIVRIVTWDTTFADTSPTASLAHQIYHASQVRNGSIVLMHCRPRTPAILAAMIPRYKAWGFTFVTVDTLLGIGGVTPTPTPTPTSTPPPTPEPASPSVEVPSPSVEPPSPSVEVASPPADLPSPSVEVASPPADVPSPSVEVPSPPTVPRS